MTDKEKSELQKEIVDGLPLCPHGRLILAPRVGKSKIAIDIIKKGKPKSILWVTPSAELAEVDIPKEFKIWKAEKYLKCLQTTTWMSLHKVEGKFDLIILDEEQFITEANAVNLINGSLSGQIISMTGTETKHADKQMLYSALNLKVLYRLSVNAAVDMGLLSNYSVSVVDIDMDRTSKVIKGGSKDKPFMTTEFANYQYVDRIAQQAIFQKRKDATFRILARRRAIINSPSKDKVTKYLWDTLKGRKLFFCSSIEQANSITEQTYHSKTDNKYLQQFIKGEIDEICMVNAGGTGFTYKSIDHLVIVQADSDKNGLTLQKVCRTLLAQGDYVAKIWILCLSGTQDESWVASTLKGLDKKKVEFVSAKNFK